MRCIECLHFSARQQQKALVAKGLYRCTKDKPWVFRSPFANRECDKFTQVSPEDLPARLAFEQKATQQ